MAKVVTAKLILVHHLCLSKSLSLACCYTAFKHGASESRFTSFIHIEMKLDSGILKFSIKNTKENNSQKCTGSNIGLNNVKRQLELLYTEYDMKVLNEASIFIVLLTINLKSYAKNNLSYR